MASISPRLGPHCDVPRIPTYLLSIPDWTVFDHLRQELILSLAVDAGQVSPLCLVTTDLPAG